MHSDRTSGPRHVAALTLAALIGGCASIAPGMAPLGTPIAQVRQAWVSPTGEYPLPGGGTRLEFSQGSFGRQTHMLDFDAKGVLVASEQVLTEDNFATIVPGMASREVRMRLGRPAQVFNVGWQNLQVWNYRYAGGDCVWFQVSIGNADARVTETGTGYDPACDGPEIRE
jgi:hypothetical protein